MSTTTPGPGRSPEQIRESIEANRRELAVSVDRLHGEVVRLTDWRSQSVATGGRSRSAPRWRVS